MSGYLGFVAWYTVRAPGDERVLEVTVEHLKDWFKELGLDESFLPGSNRSVDAFRKATTATSEPYTSDDGHTYRLTVREVTRQPDLVARQVMRTGQDAGSSTTRVADLKYYRARRTPSGRVADSEDMMTTLHRGLRGVDLKKVREFVEECLQRYERARAQLTPHQVRALLRAYLADLRGVPIPCATGAYFVPIESLKETRALQEFVSRVGAESRMLLMPLVDDTEQRTLLAEAVDTDIDERARQALADISKWQDRHPGQTPGPRTMAAWYAECRRQQDLLLAYGDRYDLTFPTAADSLEELRAATQRMTDRVVASARRRA